MNKARFLIAVCALMMGAVATWAQTDFTSHVKTTWKGQSGTTTGNHKTIVNHIRK